MLPRRLTASIHVFLIHIDVHTKWVYYHNFMIAAVPCYTVVRVKRSNLIRSMKMNIKLWQNVNGKHMSLCVDKVYTSIQMFSHMC